VRIHNEKVVNLKGAGSLTRFATGFAVDDDRAKYLKDSGLGNLADLMRITSRTQQPGMLRWRAQSCAMYYEGGARGGPLGRDCQSPPTNLPRASTRAPPLLRKRQQLPPLAFSSGLIFNARRMKFILLYANQLNK
jgi:hypothetical protein